MKAKYPGKCGVCGGSVRVGDEINWSKASGASHFKCPSKSGIDQRSAGRAPSRTSIAKRPNSDGVWADTLPQGWREVEADGRGAYIVGQLVAIRGVDGWWRVQAWRDVRHTQYSDDVREGCWVSVAQVRAATEDEIAASPEVARKKAKEDRAAAAKEWNASLGESLGRGAKLAEPVRTIGRRPSAGTLASLEYAVVSDGVVYEIRPVYDDEPVVRRSALSPDAAEQMMRRMGWI